MVSTSSHLPWVCVWHFTSQRLDEVFTRQIIHVPVRLYSLSVGVFNVGHEAVVTGTRGERELCKVGSTCNLLASWSFLRGRSLAPARARGWQRLVPPSRHVISAQKKKLASYFSFSLETVWPKFFIAAAPLASGRARSSRPHHGSGRCAV